MAGKSFSNACVASGFFEASLIFPRTRRPRNRFLHTTHHPQFSEGVIAVDPLPTLGPRYLQAIHEVTDKPIKYIVYSHSHSDHIGAAYLFPKDAIIVAQKETAEILVRRQDTRRPLPTLTFDQTYTLKAGDQVLMLGVSPPFSRLLPTVMSHHEAFSYPSRCSAVELGLLASAKLTASKLGCVENVFRAAPHERAFYEVERILRNDQERLEQLPASAAALFNPATVGALS